MCQYAFWSSWKMYVFQLNIWQGSKYGFTKVGHRRYLCEINLRASIFLNILFLNIILIWNQSVQSGIWFFGHFHIFHWWFFHWSNLVKRIHLFYPLGDNSWRTQNWTISWILRKVDLFLKEKWKNQKLQFLVCYNIFQASNLVTKESRKVS